jgi:hypothetical protein
MHNMSKAAERDITMRLWNNSGDAALFHYFVRFDRVTALSGKTLG